MHRTVDTRKNRPVASTAYVKRPLTNGLVSAPLATQLAACAVIMTLRIPVLAADVVNADRQLAPPPPRIQAYPLAAIDPTLGVEMPSASPPDGTLSARLGAHNAGRSVLVLGDSRERRVRLAGGADWCQWW